MKRIRFTRGSSYVDVIIEGRKINFTTPLLNHVPIKIDLDKLEEHKDRLSKMKMDTKILKKLSLLKTEEDMLKDLIKDMGESGWKYFLLG